MANIKINWTNPVDVNDVDGIRVLRTTVAAASDPAPACTAYTALAARPGDALPSGVTLAHDTASTPAASSAGSYVDQGLTAGHYHFAVFSYNGAGYSPCTSTTAATTVV